MSDKRKFDFRLIWLKSFLAVIEHGGFSAAAKAMDCNQSTISRNVQDLEMWLGMTFFDLKVPMRLSDEGMKFRDVAAEVVSMLESRRTLLALDKVSKKIPPESQPKVIKSRTVYRPLKS